MLEASHESNEEHGPEIEMKFGLFTEVANYGAGKYFGEKSIEENMPRAATIIVKSEECILASLTRANYVSAVGDAFKLIREEEILLMRRFDIFKSFSKRKLVHLFYYLEETNYY